MAYKLRLPPLMSLEQRILARIELARPVELAVRGLGREGERTLRDMVLDGRVRLTHDWCVVADKERR